VLCVAGNNVDGDIWRLNTTAQGLNKWDEIGENVRKMK
jgi:hypothetical protein